MKEIAERAQLWSKFSMILRAVGLDPVRYMKEFDDRYEAIKAMPLDEQERAVERLAGEIVRRELVPLILLPAVLPAVLAPPRVTTRHCKYCGASFTAPDEVTLYYLERIHRFSVDYYLSCAKCKGRYHGYPDLPVMIDEAIRWRLVDPVYWPWLRELVRLLKTPETRESDESKG